MELTRRDALAALAAAGVSVGAGATLLSRQRGDLESRPLGDELDTLGAVADVLYPDSVDGVSSFVERYAGGLVENRPRYAEQIGTSATYVDDYARSWHDQTFSSLDAATRDEVLRDMGADVASADPDGSDVERVRYYVVNELLFALYTSPTGGELVGLENPQGHPGGVASYQRGPDP